jgi:hypothetical protein
MAPANSSAATSMVETPMRGLACLRSSSAVSPHSLPADLATGSALVGKVYVPYPAVPGPGGSIRALRANFKPFWLDLVVADDKALDPSCMITVDQSGYLHRLDIGPGTWQARREADANEQVATWDLGR